jgi:hypothetical protein
MIMTLLWLTVSTPFVYAGQQVQKENSSKQTGDNNPFSNTTEEKSESGVTTLSEYLHECLHIENFSSLVIKFYRAHRSDPYFDFYPELISPPPEA